MKFSLNKSRLPTILSLIVGIFLCSGCSNSKDYSTNIEAKPLAFSMVKQLKLSNCDYLGRPINAHIQLSYNDLPKEDREPFINVDPVGWHNYRFVDKNGKKYWAFNRGHLIGYQFCGLNDEKRNLVMMTAYLNKGAHQGMDANNKEGMLFYEQSLRQYLETHRHDKLDYQVTPIYQKDELVPRAIRLSFLAYDQNGKARKIIIPSSKVKYKDELGIVVLENKDPNIKINYQTGTAIKH